MRCHQVKWLLLPGLCLSVVVFMCIRQQQQPQQQSSTVTEKLQINNILSKVNPRFPRIFIIGFGKAGTRALYETLLLHDGVVGPKKEMRFFDNYYDYGLRWYLHKLPSPKPNQQVAEKSPSYILHPEALKRLKIDSKLLGVGLDELKIVVMFRHPIVRAISEYLEWQVLKSRKNEKLLPSFGKAALNFKGQWMEAFNREQFCFVNGEKFAEHPYEEFSLLEKCLGLLPQITQENFYWSETRKLYCLSQNKAIRCPSMSKGRPHPFIKENVVDTLMKYFKPFNEQLYALTGENYGWDDSYKGINIL